MAMYKLSVNVNVNMCQLRDAHFALIKVIIASSKFTP